MKWKLMLTNFTKCKQISRHINKSCQCSQIQTNIKSCQQMLSSIMLTNVNQFKPMLRNARKC